MLTHIVKRYKAQVANKGKEVWHYVGNDGITYRIESLCKASGLYQTKINRRFRKMVIYRKDLGYNKLILSKCRLLGSEVKPWLKKKPGPRKQLETRSGKVLQRPTSYENILFKTPPAATGYYISDRIEAEEKAKNNEPNRYLGGRIERDIETLKRFNEMMVEKGYLQPSKFQNIPQSLEDYYVKSM